MPEVPKEWLQGEKLTTGQVAHFFGVSRETVNRWAKDCTVGFFLTPHGERRYPECEILRLANVEPIDPEVVELAQYLNSKITGRWEKGYRRNDYIVNCSKKAEAGDDDDDE